MPFRWGDSRCSVWKTPGWQVQEGPSLWGAQTLTCSQLSYQFTLATSSCPGVGTLGKCKLRGINWGGGVRVLVFLYKQELLSLLINSPSVSLRPSSSVILLGYVIGNIALFFFFLNLSDSLRCYHLRNSLRCVTLNTTKLLLSHVAICISTNYVSVVQKGKGGLVSTLIQAREDLYLE